MNVELVRNLATLGLIGVFVWWLSRKDERKEKFHPKNYLNHVRHVVSVAGGMDRGDWVKYLGVSSTLTLVALLTVPAVPALLQDEGGVQVSDENHPVNQISEVGDSPIYGMLLLFVAFGTIPIFEEWLTRKKLLSYIKDQDFPHSTFVALLVSSFAFGCLHLLNAGTTIYALLPPFVGGLIFGVAYLVEGFKASCFTHVAYNELVLIIMYASVFF